jgi:hypothetical protein
LVSAQPPSGTQPSGAQNYYSTQLDLHYCGTGFLAHIITQILLTTSPDANEAGPANPDCIQYKKRTIFIHRTSANDNRQTSNGNAQHHLAHVAEGRSGFLSSHICCSLTRQCRAGDVEACEGFAFRLRGCWSLPLRNFCSIPKVGSSPALRATMEPRTHRRSYCCSCGPSFRCCASFPLCTDTAASGIACHYLEEPYPAYHK